MTGIAEWMLLVKEKNISYDYDYFLQSGMRGKKQIMERKAVKMENEDGGRGRVT